MTELTCTECSAPLDPALFEGVTTRKLKLCNMCKVNHVTAQQAALHAKRKAEGTTVKPTAAQRAIWSKSYYDKRRADPEKLAAYQLADAAGKRNREAKFRESLTTIVEE